jgi:hypothetical protein
MPPVSKPPEQRRRRNAAPSFDTLPASGPGRRAPNWPLGEATPAETALWRDLWSRPIAAAWHSQRIAPIVIARYVRTVLASPSHAALTAMEAGLGLTPAALARLHLRVEPATEPEPVAELGNIEEARRRWEASQ